MGHHMPLPEPTSGESRDDFMERCVPEAAKEAESNDQAVAICMGKFRGSNSNMKQIRVNVSARVNNAAITEGERNGRKVMIVPSATLPFNVVMNGGLYPEDEIRNGYMTLEKTLAPIGHPMVNGQYVSAMDPEAINAHHVGAWNENVRIDGNRVKLDKIIDVERAQSTDMGRELLEAINKNEPIHTSTGLILDREDVEGNDDYEWVARNMQFDHDAILIGDIGAATPEQGVGMMVNGEQVEVQNVSVDMLDDEIDHVGQMLFELVERREEKSKWLEVKDKVVDYVKSLVQSTSEGADGLAVNSDHEEDVMSEIKREEFDALVTKVDTLVSNAEKAPSVSDQITEALKPVTEQLQANAEAEKAKAAAEHEAAVTKVVEANILDKEVAEKMDTIALNALVEKFAKPAGSYGAINAFKGDAPALGDLSNELPGGE